MQGGEEVVLGDPEADVCTFLEVAVMLAPGLRDAAMLPLFKAARLVLALKKPAAQKKAYKALAYLFTQRAGLLDAHPADAVAVLLDSAGVDAAAKRHRLRCILPVILLVTRGEDGGATAAAAALPGAADSPAQAARLVTELVLGIKEVNTKTRVEAYSVLVRMARALHESQPPQRSLSGAPPDSPTQTWSSHVRQPPRCASVTHDRRAVSVGAVVPCGGGDAVCRADEGVHACGVQPLMHVAA